MLSKQLSSKILKIHINMNNPLVRTDFHFPGQTKVYHGKVRDVYFLEGDLLVMVATDRISAFDVILPGGINDKGAILNQIAAEFLDLTKDILPNWKLDVPHPMVTIGRCCKGFPIEMIIRGYLSGHAWREYAAGKRELCGVKLPDGLKENQQLPHPIITPTTKAIEGHDEDVTRQEIIDNGLISERDYALLEDHTYKLFARGQEIANKRGLILVDTKYEFGQYGDQILLIDEIHTPDSSRYLYLEGYQERLEKGQPQRQLSKEFVRQWLIEQGFQGQEGQQPPTLSPQMSQNITARYEELYEHILGKKYVSDSATHTAPMIEQAVNSWLQSHK